MDSQTLPLPWKHFPKVNKPLSYNSEHKKVISNAVFKVKAPDFARNLMQLSGFAKKIVISQFCMVGIPPRNQAQSRYFGKISAEMESSRAVRIRNIKCCNFPTSMSKVMARSLRKENLFFLVKRIDYGEGMDSDFKINSG